MKPFWGVRKVSSVVLMDRLTSAAGASARPGRSADPFFFATQNVALTNHAYPDRMEQDRKWFRLRTSRRAGVAVALQLTGFVLGTALLLFWPRQEGNVLLVPTTATLAATVDIALANHGRIVAAMPAVDGIVVTGDVARMALPILRHGTLVIGVPAAFCGSPSVARARAA